MDFIENNNYLSLHTVRLEEHCLFVATSRKKHDVSTMLETTTFSNTTHDFPDQVQCKRKMVCCKVTNTDCLPEKKVSKSSNVQNKIN